MTTAKAQGQATTTKKGPDKKELARLKRLHMARKGEDLACDFLVRHKMKVVDRNWRCSYGEADIIALDDRTLVFCEVKTRKTRSHGSPELAVTRKKLSRYKQLVNVYCSRCAIRHRAVRFDVITIFVDELKGSARLRYIRDAYAGS
ncbi:MAG: YraN family protein [Coriobacteriia bacterium]|nr:YraN family protein [Coriobacteriia bacterium]MCL2537357.1 YraN family protein [Coriobacteriia bacterium]